MGDEFCEGADAPGETAAPSAPASHAYMKSKRRRRRRGAVRQSRTKRNVP